MKEKRVCFFGPRDDWKIIGIYNKVYSTFEQLVSKGYTTFFDGDKGAFDKLCERVLNSLKLNHNEIKIFKILSYFNPRKKISSNDIVIPELELYYPKQRITIRNKWIVDNCDLAVFYIHDTYKSGSYSMLKYAKKQGKQIIII